MPTPATRQLLVRLGILGGIATVLVVVDLIAFSLTEDPALGMLILSPILGVLLLAVVLVLVHLLRTATPVVRVRCRGCQALNLESANACGSGI